MMHHPELYSPFFLQNMVQFLVEPLVFMLDEPDPIEETPYRTHGGVI